MTEKDFDLAYQLMQAIRQTDEWEAIWQEYPGVTEAKAQLDAVMEQVGTAVSQELINALWEATDGFGAAFERLAHRGAVLFPANRDLIYPAAV